MTGEKARTMAKIMVIMVVEDEGIVAKDKIAEYQGIISSIAGEISSIKTNSGTKEITLTLKR